MARRDRTWLRGFLHLDAYAGAAVPRHEVERQEETVIRALELLDELPGVMLADEVGMGKTYEALGVLAARLHERRDARALILTPGPDLTTKWAKELRTFCNASRPMYGGFEGRFGTAGNLAELVDRARAKQISVAPMNIFAGSRSNFDQAYLVSLWADAQGLAGNQIAAIFRRYRDGMIGRVDFESNLFLNTFEWKRVRPHVRDALDGHKRRCKQSLDTIWNTQGYDGFEARHVIDSALADLRFRLVGRLLPDLDLLIIDEAHKLKNSETIRAKGVRTVFDGRFEKALFLTATPFQLTVAELRQVFDLFSHSKSAPPDLMDRACQFLEHVNEYTRAYDDLERLWTQADVSVVTDFGTWFERHKDLAADPDDPALRAIVASARRLLAIKNDHVEPGFRTWMIRSLREDKRKYRKSSSKRLRAKGGAGVPFMLYERFIAELFRSKNRTHKAAVQINMASSYGAARTGALLADEVKTGLGEEAEAYRKLLQRVIGELRDEGGGHPKVDYVVRDALDAAARGEKTLIFCARIETLHELKREMETAWRRRLLASWQRAFPGATFDDVFEHEVDGRNVDGHHSRLRDRFNRAQDALYVALRERYVATLLDGSNFAFEHLEPIVGRANEILRRQRVSKLQAERTDWSILKRCVEQATALVLRESGRTDDVETAALERLVDERFVPFGYDLVPDEVEDFAQGDRTPAWKIGPDDARLVLGRDHLWVYLKGPLLGIPPELRVRTVERLASYLVSRHMTFLPDLLVFAKEERVNVSAPSARALLPVVDRFWTTPIGRPWCDLLRRYLTYAGNLDEERRREVLDDVVRADSIVRHTVEGESRERLREAFNTPLHPMILVANEVMQEGLDLHHHCRRVIHHDLAWNPAQLEQRVGRVDRLGSLVQKLRERQRDVTLDVLLPLITNTIDERLERTVRMRERWLEFLLGAPPKIEEYGLADEPAQPLPPAFAEALRIDLGPR